MSFRQKLLSLGLEDDQSAVVAEGTVDTGAQELLEVNEVASEIDQTHEAIEEAQDSSEQLEEVAAGLESMIEAGRGLSADAAMFAHQAAGFATRKFGIAAPMPSMESFSTGASGQFAQTKASLEGIKETIQKIWNWIKAQFAKLRGHIKDFWLKTFDGAARLKKRADAMAKKASSVTGAAKEANVTVPADLVAKLHVNNQLDVDSALAVLKPVVEEFMEKATDASVEAAEKAADAVKSSDFADAGKLQQAIIDFVKAIGGTGFPSVCTHNVSSEKAYEYVKEDPAGNLEARATSELPGGQRVVYVAQTKIAQDPEAGLKAAAKVKGMLVPQRDKAAEAKEKKIPTLPGTKVQNLCEEVSALATLVEGFRRNFQNQEKAKDAFVSAGKHVESEAPKAEKLDAAGQKLATLFARSINVLPSLIDQPAQKVAQYTVSTLNAVLNYAQLSLSQYK
jgi:hypothetical protein